MKDSQSTLSNSDAPLLWVWNAIENWSLKICNWLLSGCLSITNDQFSMTNSQSTAPNFAAFRKCFLPILAGKIGISLGVCGGLLLTASHCPAQGNSVLPHGDFEQADPRDPARPAGWDRVDGLGVQWTQAPDAAHGKAIRMDTRLSEQAMQAQWIKTGLTNIWNIP